MKLIDFKYNIYSQFGEDGVISKIFSIIGEKTKLCVEFGAWDGIYLSNTANLWKNKSWKAILIESDPERIKSLNHENILPINAFVGLDENNSIDFILKNNNIIEDIDFMSIDIDGNDYHIFDLLKIKPRVICIEFNPTIPFWMDIYQNKNKMLGASLGSLNRLANSKGYKLVGATDCNAFFVLESEFNKFSEFNTNLADIACYDYYNITITDFTGKYKKIGNYAYGLSSELTDEIAVLKGISKI